MSVTDNAPQAELVPTDAPQADNQDSSKTKTEIQALSADVAALRAVVDGLPAQVVNLLLAGHNLAGFPDDMGIPKEYQLGQAYQNYMVWSANMGTSRALQSPENLLFLATMMDAMAVAESDPVAKLNAAQKALDDMKRALRG